MVFQFEHMELDHGGDEVGRPSRCDLRELKRVAGALAGRAWPSTGWNSLYWNNHDQPRAVSRFGDDGELPGARRPRCSATLLHLHRGTPYVYQGEELGMTNVPFAGIDDYRDIEIAQPLPRGGRAAAPTRSGVLAAIAAMSRDNARTPMQWDACPHAGFTTGEPWIAVNPNHVEINAEAPARRPGLGLPPLPAADRAAPRASRSVAHGDFTMLLPRRPCGLCVTGGLGDVELLVVANVSGAEVTVDLPDAEVWGDEELVLTNLTGDGSLPGVLAPWEARVLRRVSGAD